MKNEQIIKKAIDKAVKNGLLSEEEWGLFLKIIGIEYLLKTRELTEPAYYSIIFSHDFCRAFWGEKRIKEIGILEMDGNMCDFEENLFVWQYHLQTMVLEEEPLLYLKKFIKQL